MYTIYCTRYLMHCSGQQGLMPALDSDMAEVITGSEFIVKAYAVHWQLRPTYYFYAKGGRWGPESRAIQASDWESTVITDWWHEIGWNAALCLPWVQRPPLKQNVCRGCKWGCLFSIGSSKNWADEQGFSVHCTLHWLHVPGERNFFTSYIWRVSVWRSCEGQM